MKKKLFVAFRTFFFLGIGLFFIWYFLRNFTEEQKKEIYDSFLNADFSWFFISIIVGILSHVFRGLRWMQMLAPMGYRPKKLNVMYAVFIGYLANLALPRLGEVSKCGVLAKYEKIPLNKGLGTIVTERVLDLIVLIILFSLTIALNFARLNQYFQEKVFIPLQQKFTALQDTQFLLYFMMGSLVLFVVLLFLIRKYFPKHPWVLKIKHLITGFWEGVSSLKNMKNPGLFILYTFLIWFNYWLMTYIVFFSLKETSVLNANAGLIVLMFGSIGMIVVQGGIGIYPAIVAETLLLFAIPEPIGYAYGWLVWVAQQLMIVTLGALSFALLPITNRNYTPTPHVQQ
ncbi:MAG: TIGR00374 family protein [Bacteroidetes bacterium]|nr:MAG: TIGR00374 family protein [Bacteroidota bacterium]